MSNEWVRAKSHDDSAPENLPKRTGSLYDQLVINREKKLEELAEKLKPKGPKKLDESEANFLMETQMKKRQKELEIRQEIDKGVQKFTEDLKNTVIEPGKLPTDVFSLITSKPKEKKVTPELNADIVVVKKKKTKKVDDKLKVKDKIKKPKHHDIVQEVKKKQKEKPKGLLSIANYGSDDETT